MLLLTAKVPWAIYFWSGQTAPVCKGEKTIKTDKLYQKIISKGSFSSNHSTAVSYETISTNTLNRQNNSSFYDLVLLLVWFLVEKSMDQIYLRSRISVWTTYTEIVVALLCEKDLTRFYYIQILFYGNDVSSQENNGTNSILLVHSSEKSCLWLMKFFLKTLQNLRYFWNTKSHVLLYFFISCCINISPDECPLFYVEDGGKIQKFGISKSFAGVILHEA